MQKQNSNYKKGNQHEKNMDKSFLLNYFDDYCDCVGRPRGRDGYPSNSANSMYGNYR